LAGYKTISLALLIVLVALAGVSSLFAQDEAFITFAPAAACPGQRVDVTVTFPITTVTLTTTFEDVVGGRMSVAAMSPLAFQYLSSNPDGLIAEQECGDFATDTTVETLLCTFQVSESARCGRYTVTVTLPDEGSGPSVSGIFDVAGPCCPAVGGCVQPVNTFALVSPWLAVIGLVGCIGTVAVVAKKRRP
jgi:hypothetical protein